MNSVERADQRIGPRQRLGSRATTSTSSSSDPERPTPTTSTNCTPASWSPSGRIGYIVDYQGARCWCRANGLRRDGGAVRPGRQQHGENTARDITRLAVALAVGVAIAAVSGVVLARRWPVR